LKAKPKPTKRDDVKENILRVRASNAHLDTLNQRSATVGMPVSTYMLWRSLKPLGQLKKKKAQQDISRLDYEAYLSIRKEFNRQGINLNQIAKALNSDKMHSQSIAHTLKDITAIREANEAILLSIAHLGKNNDWHNN
jgi:Bacterial mobilisation protein (MobC)